MAQDLPSAEELLDAVKEFLEEELPDRLDGRAKFHARVAANVVGIVARELRMGASFDAEESARLGSLLGEPVDDIPEANKQLAARIRDGSLDDRHAEVLDHARRTSADKLRIANPSYLDE